MTWSLVVSFLCNFYGWNPEYVLWELNFDQVLVWFKNMGIVKSGKLPIKEFDAKGFKDQFVKDENTGKWILKDV